MDLCKSANAEFGASSSICFYAVHSWPLKSGVYVSNANMRFLFLSGRQRHASSSEGRHYRCSLVQSNDGSYCLW